MSEGRIANYSRCRDSLRALMAAMLDGGDEDVAAAMTRYRQALDGADDVVRGEIRKVIQRMITYGDNTR